jgi:putrescine transport system ATP-binding protein
VLDGQDLAELPPYERPINMMFQSYALFPHLTVWENIAFGLKQRGPAKDPDRRTRVEAMLKLVQLGKFAKRKPHQLSGGQQQRVALARSLAKQAASCCCWTSRWARWTRSCASRPRSSWSTSSNRSGVTCVMVTHDQEEAMTMATRIALMLERHRLGQLG